MRTAKAIPTLTEKDKARFFSKISNVLTERGCLEWTACKTQDGYGRFWLGGKNHGAHRVAFVLGGGVFPEGKPDANHHCDNPVCCNPTHLYAGNHQNNVDDRGARGRNNPARGDSHYSRIHPERIVHGEGHYNANLKESDIPAIRADPRFQRIIAADYGVHQMTISRIKNRKAWAHVA